MHAVVVRVNIGDSEAAAARPREDVVLRVLQAPGFVAGYWTRKDNTGLSMLVFESEEAATNAEERCARICLMRSPLRAPRFARS